MVPRDFTFKAMLSISLRTVQSHITGILTRLDAHSRAEAAAIAVRRGLV